MEQLSRDGTNVSERLARNKTNTNHRNTGERMSQVVAGMLTLKHWRRTRGRQRTVDDGLARLKINGQTGHRRYSSPPISLPKWEKYLHSAVSANGHPTAVNEHVGSTLGFTKCQECNKLGLAHLPLFLRLGSPSSQSYFDCAHLYIILYKDKIWKY